MSSSAKVLGGMVLSLLLTACTGMEMADIEYGILGQQQLDESCVIVSGEHRGYYFGINRCLQNNELKQALHNRIKDHKVLPYTRNTGSYPSYFTKHYITLGNFAEEVPDRFDVWDAYVVFATKGANPYYSGVNCAAGKLLDWYDYRCYDTPNEIMSVSSGGQQDPGSADPLVAPTPLWGNEGVYNREHSWPKSFFLASSASGYCQSKPEITGNSDYYDYRAFTDLHHLIPARKSVNETRGTCAFGIVAANDTHFPRESGAKFGTPAAMANYSFSSIPGCSSNKVLEPPPELKGDIARIYFYIATRYYTEDDCWKSNYQVTKASINLWLETVLRDWHAADPVSADERVRNDWIHRIQGNRNPFVDHPEWINQIADF